MYNKITLSVLLLVTCTTILTAQVGIGTTDPKAMLDIQSSDSGILIPRVALTETSDQSPITAPAPELGLMVFNTATLNDVSPGFYYWEDDSWIPMSGSMSGSRLVYENTTFVDNVYIDSNNGNPTVGSLGSVYSFSLDKPTLVEIRLSFEVIISRFNLNPVRNGNPILYGMALTHGSLPTGSIVLKESKSYTSSATTGTINSGNYTLGSNSYIYLPSGNHEFHLYLLGAGGGDHGFDIWCPPATQSDLVNLQIIYHN